MRSFTKVIVVLAAVLVGSFAAVPAGPKQSPAPRKQPRAVAGIRVVAELGPMTPSQRIDQPVPPSPYATEIVVLAAADRREVARFMTDPRGQHTVELPPGDYVVASAQADSPRRPQAEEQLVIVPADQIVTVTMSFDSGIR